MQDNAQPSKIDWSASGRPRVWALTALGTLVCIVVAFLVDSYDFPTGTWRWGTDPVNNVLIPLLLAPPFFYLLLDKMRQLAIAHHELMNVASTDSLTSLLNRRAFTEMVDGYLKRVEDAEKTVEGALLVIDVDHFKAVNDRFGHDQGDEALKLIAGTIRQAVRETDLVGRMGGEEFCVFMPGQPADGADAAAERIRIAVTQARFLPGGARHDLSVSVGGVTFANVYPFPDLYSRADERLYAAKNNGRNCVELMRFRPGEPIPAILH
ncbi:MAG: GGDEF domain-containing protein [Hyphomonas sp.]|nr:GGDEF domain-containing protein [Hyphomonas sp.]